MRYKEVVKKISVPAENKIKQKQYIENGRLPVIDQGSKLIGGYSDDEEKIVKCNLPVIVFGDHTKCVKYVNFPFCAGADGIKVLARLNSGISRNHDFSGIYDSKLELTKPNRLNQLLRRDKITPDQFLF